MALLRADKLLADTGRWSRRDAKLLLRSGRVLINGKVVLKGESKVETEGMVLEVDGVRVTWQRFTWLMMNKPAGYLTATRDHRQKTVLELLSPELQRQELRPVGRLDKDTEGLLLLTNDGEMAHRLLSPKYHVDKVYYAEIDGTVEEEDVCAFAAGMTLSDGTVCQSALLESLGECRCRVTVREGKFHQVKRMLSQRGKEVLYLKRLSMGGLCLDNGLEKGEYRPLTEIELRLLGG